MRPSLESTTFKDWLISPKTICGKTALRWGVGQDALKYSAETEDRVSSLGLVYLDQLLIDLLGSARHGENSPQPQPPATDKQ